jgi:hypothetical protein
MDLVHMGNLVPALGGFRLPTPNRQPDNTTQNKVFEMWIRCSRNTELYSSFRLFDLQCVTAAAGLVIWLRSYDELD